MEWMTSSSGSSLESFECSEPAGGYDYEFVDTPMDSLVCKICHYPSREPHLTVCCGHTFCNSCVKNTKKSTVLSDACPICRTEQFTTVPNKQNERAVLSLHVLCTNTKRGCEWIGEVGGITGHLTNSSGCKYEEIPCPNSCGKTCERQYLAVHVEECPRRSSNCQYCNAEGEYQFIAEGSHKQQCNRFPVPCPNKCEIGNVPRENLKEHRKVCPLEIVQCQYHDVGCEAETARKDLVRHNEENTNEHLLLMKSTLIATQNKLADTQNKLADTQNKLANTQNKLVDTQKKLSKTENRLGETKNKLASTEHKLADTKHDLTGMKDELADQEQRLVSAECTLEGVTDKVELAEFESDRQITSVRDQIDELKTALKQKTKLFDTLFGEWVIEIHTRATKLSSCNQLLPVIIKMPDFGKNMREKSDWYSDPFYTHHQGYKMQLNVVPAGHGLGEGCCMSVYLCIMDGPYDHLLKWKLRGKFQVTLLNQLSDSMHHSVSFKVYANRSQSRPFWYSVEFISHEELRRTTVGCQFYKDNCVFFAVSEL